MKNKDKDFEYINEAELDYGKIKDDIVIDDQSEMPKTETKSIISYVIS